MLLLYKSQREEVIRTNERIYFLKITPFHIDLGFLVFVSRNVVYLFCKTICVKICFDIIC